MNRGASKDVWIFAMFLLLIFIVSTVAQPAQALDVTQTHFYYPSGTKVGVGNWLLTGWDGYRASKYHLGSDISTARRGHDVYAIADGTEVKVYFDDKTRDADFCYIWIKHRAINPSNGQDFPFWAVYGHIEKRPGLGSTVKAGQVIGTVMPYHDDADHLHFGINLGGPVTRVATRETTYFNSSSQSVPLSVRVGWGRGGDLPSDWGKNLEKNKPLLARRDFVNPIEFIENYRPASIPRPTTIKTSGTVGGIYVNGRLVGRGNVGLLLQPGSYVVFFTDEPGYRTPVRRTLIIPDLLGSNSLAGTQDGIVEEGVYDLRYRSEFMRHVTVPDGEIHRPGEPFQKIWELRNLGTDTWTPGFTLRYTDGDDFGPNRVVPLPGNVAQGEAVQIGVDLTTPTPGGTRNSNWQLFTPEGTPFGARVGVQVLVQAYVDSQWQPGERPDHTIDLRFVDAFYRNGGRDVVGRPLDYVREFAGGQLQEFNEGSGGRGNLSAPGGWKDVFWLHGAIYGRYDTNLDEPFIQSDLLDDLGLPISDEYGLVTRSGNPGRISNLERGILAHHQDGAFKDRTFEVHGAIYQTYHANGEAGGSLGYPVSDEFVNSNHQPQSNFEGGFITRDGEGAPYTVRSTDVSGYKASLVFQDDYKTSTRQYWVRYEARFRNDGTQTWYRDLTPAHPRVSLRTAWPDDHGTRLYTEPWGGWITPTRIHMDELEVPPGGIAHYIFWMAAIGGTSGGTSQEHFDLCLDYGDVATSFSQEIGLYWGVTVPDPDPYWAAMEVEQGAQYLTLYSGQKSDVWVKYENIGMRTWEPRDAPNVRLGTSGERNRPSPFYNPKWINPSRPCNSGTDALGTGGHRIFQLTLQAPNVDSPRVFTEEYSLVADGPDGEEWFPWGTWVRWFITVLPDPAPPNVDRLVFDKASPSNTNSVKISLDVADHESGVRRVVVRANTASDGSDKGTWIPVGEFSDKQSETLPWDISSRTKYPDGTHRIAVEAWDYAGNRLAPENAVFHFKIDRTGPNVTLRRTVPPPATPTGWNAVPVTGILSATDPTGVGGIFFAWDQQQNFARYQSPMSAPEGIHTLYFYGIDSLGNKSTVRSGPFRVDTGLPDTKVTSLVTNPSTGATTFLWSGSDAVTAIKELRYSYRMDGGTWSAWSNSNSVTVPVATSGPHRFEVRAKDLAGNEDSTPAERIFASRYEISGQVTANGAGLAGVKVKVGNVQLTTDGDGLYFLPNLVAGKYPVVPTSDRFTFQPAQASVTVGPDQNVDFQSRLIVHPLSVALTPARVTGGQTAKGTVTLDAAAPAGGETILLRSSDTAVATVLGSVKLAEGVKSTTFDVATKAVASTTPVTLSASLNGVTRSATLTVDPAALLSVTLNPVSVTGGINSTGTVTLNGPAPSGGATITLSSTKRTTADVPPSILVLAGATKGTFSITTQPVPNSTPVNISGTFGGVTKTATVTVEPPELLTLTLSPTSVKGGKAAHGTVTLSGKAPAGGITVALASSKKKAAKVPKFVRVPAGQNAGRFRVTTSAVKRDTSVTVSSALRNTLKTAELQVLKPHRRK